MSERPVQTEEVGSRSGTLPTVEPDFVSGGPAAVQQSVSWSRQGMALAISLVVIAGGAFALHSRQGNADAQKPAVPAARPQPVVTVTVATAAVQPLTRILEVTGSVSAWDPLAIGAEATGLAIEQILVEEGDRVRRGQVLALLNDSVLQAQRSQAQARLRSADVATSQRRSALIKSEVTYKEALANQRRYEDLFRQGAISSQEVLARQTAAQGSKADLDQARLGIDAALGSTAENRAQLAQIQAQIAQTRILAPDDGLISRRDAHIGDIVSSSKTLFAMVRDNRLELRAQVPEVDLPKIRPGQRVRVTSDADPTMAVTGRVRQISPLVDDRTRLGTARIDVPGVRGMRPGMFVRGQVALGERRAVVVPSQAVITREDGVQVFTLKGEQAVARTITTGTRSGDRVEITSGLQPGEKVIVAGAGYLKDGDYVRLPKANTQ